MNSDGNPVSLIAKAFFAGLLCMTVGCNPVVEEKKSTVDVTGSVFLDDQPVSDATVVFIPMKANGEEGRHLPISIGKTDAEGNFDLLQTNGKPGAVKGRHIVMISKKLDAGSKLPAEVKERHTDEFEKPTDSQLLKRSQLARDTSQNSMSDLIPVLYNKYSILELEIDPAVGQVRPRFNLTTIDPLLISPTKTLIDHASIDETEEGM